MRLSPVKHPVSGYTRKDGKRVGEYTRGSRKPSKKKTKTIKSSSNPNRAKNSGRKNVGYSVTLFYGDKSETHPIQSDSLPDAAYQGLQALEAAKIPRRMRIKVN